FKTDYIMKSTLKISVLALSSMLLSFTPSTTSFEKSVDMNCSIKNSIKWKSTEIVLGEIPQNKPITIEFEFTNDGDGPVIISSVQASCGCTSTNFAKTPVLPGETTKITAVFNAATVGLFKKQITVVTNAEVHPKTLMFTGTVI